MRTRGHIVSVGEARKILGSIARGLSDDQIEQLIVKLDTLAKALVISSKDSAKMHISGNEGSSK